MELGDNDLEQAKKGTKKAFGWAWPIHVQILLAFSKPCSVQLFCDKWCPIYLNYLQSVIDIDEGVFIIIVRCLGFVTINCLWLSNWTQGASSLCKTMQSTCAKTYIRTLPRVTSSKIPNTFFINKDLIYIDLISSYFFPWNVSMMCITMKTVHVCKPALGSLLSTK